MWIFCIKNLNTLFSQDTITFGSPGTEISYPFQSLNKDNAFEFTYFQQKGKQYVVRYWEILYHLGISSINDELY